MIAVAQTTESAAVENDAAPDTNESAGGGQLVTTSGLPATQTGGLSQFPPTDMWDRIPDPMAFAFHIGGAMYKSGLYGFTNVAQGQVMAMICCLGRRNPMEVMTTYHVVKDKLTMRADQMLSRFNLAGGDHEWVSMGDDGIEARAKFVWKKRRTEVAFTIEEAKAAGLLNKKSGSGPSSWEKNPGSMLRARCVSKAIRMICPQLIAGFYAPEELGGDDTATPATPTTATTATDAADVAGFTAQAVADGGFGQHVATAEAAAAKAAVSAATVAAKPAAAAAVAPAPVAAKTAAGPVAAKSAAVATPAPAHPATAAPAAIETIDSASVPAVEMITAEQLEWMRVYKNERLKLGSDEWKATLAKRLTAEGTPVQKASQLTKQQADELLGRMEAKWQRKLAADGLQEMPTPVAPGVNVAPVAPAAAPTTAVAAPSAKPKPDLNAWANGQVAKNLASGMVRPGVEQAPFATS